MFERPADRSHEPPRASLLAIPGDLCAPAILMGGAHTPHGNAISLEGLERAWVVDLAGDMPATYRERSGRWFARVFPDLDGDVPALPRLRSLAAELTHEIRNGASADVDRLYVMCQHGMNRSGLMAGLILRELGLSGEEALTRIVAARPGSLSNQAFRAIIEGRRP